MYRKIPLENAQRIINLTASEKEITLQKARMIKTVIIRLHIHITRIQVQLS